MVLRNKQGDEIVLGKEWVQCLKKGPIYFAQRGILLDTFVSSLLLPLTFGLSWFVYPMFAKHIVMMHYICEGYQPVGVVKYDGKWRVI